MCVCVGVWHDIIQMFFCYSIQSNNNIVIRIFHTNTQIRLMNFSFHFIKIQTKFIHWKKKRVKKEKYSIIRTQKKTSSKQTNKQQTRLMISIKTNFILLMEKKKERTTSDSVLCVFKKRNKKKQEFSHSTQKQTRKREREINLILRQEQEKKLIFGKKNPINQIHRLNKERKKMIISNSTTTGAKIISMWKFSLFENYYYLSNKNDE